MRQEDFLADIEIEKKLLSALMIDEGAAIPKVTEILKPDDFYRSEHARIFKALLSLNDEGKAVNILLVCEKLKETGELEKVGRQYAMSLVMMEYTTARAEIYAKLIRKKSLMRSLAQIGRELTDDAEHERFEPDEIQGQLEKKLEKLKSHESQNLEPIQEIILRQLQAALSPGIEKGIPTKYYFLDQYTGGLKKSDLIILAARPSMGKTAFALNIATHVAKEHSVALFSLEMSKEQLGNRMLASVGRISATKIQQGTLDDEETEAALNAASTLDHYKLFIDDTPALSLFELRQRARRTKREKGLELIVIDYLQLIQASKEYRGNRVQEVSELSRGLKTLARELDIPVIALSQLSRNVELRADKRPQLSDLRESGSIEQDADIVMFLYREEYYDKDTDLSNIAEVIIAKNRNGKTSSFKMHYEPNYLLFSDLARKEPY